MTTGLATDSTDGLKEGISIEIVGGSTVSYRLLEPHFRGIRIQFQPPYNWMVRECVISLSSARDAVLLQPVLNSFVPVTHLQTITIGYHSHLIFARITRTNLLPQS